MSNSSRNSERAANILKDRFENLGSWREVARQLKDFNYATLNAVAARKRKPPYKLLEALGVVSKRKPEVIRYRWIGRWVAEHGQGFIK